MKICKKSSFDYFESALYSTSVSMPLIVPKGPCKSDLAAPLYTQAQQRCTGFMVLFQPRFLYSFYISMKMLWELFYMLVIEHLAIESRLVPCEHFPPKFAEGLHKKTKTISDQPCIFEFCSKCPSWLSCPLCPWPSEWPCPPPWLWPCPPPWLWPCPPPWLWPCPPPWLCPCPPPPWLWLTPPCEWLWPALRNTKMPMRLTRSPATETVWNCKRSNHNINKIQACTISSWQWIQCSFYMYWMR